MTRALAILLIVILCSCNGNVLESEYASIPDTWSKNEPITFNIKAPDTLHAYDMYINLRTNHEYKFSNLWMITAMEFPNGKIVTDTLQYEMAYPDGTLMGHGMSDTKESKLWYKEGIRFRESGTYTLKIHQAMRQNGQVKGVQNLTGITEVGYSLEKPNTDG